MAKEKITPSDLYTELASMERIIYNLRSKIAQTDGGDNIENGSSYDSANHVEVLGKRLKEKRESRGYNLFYAARKSGLRYETIQNLEEGKGTIKNFVKYGSSLGLFFCFLPSLKY